MMMEMMGMFGGVFMLLMFLPLIAMGAFIPVLVYLVARWRNQHESAETPDTQIGLKVAVHLFRVLGFQLTLSAVFLFLLGVISELPTGDTVRIALGLGIPAGGVWALHIVLGQRTNGAVFPAVQRMFDGWNLIITGIPGFLAMVAFFVILFADTPGAKSDLLRVVAPYLMTYTGAWGLLGFLWFRNAGLLPAGAPPQSYPPAQGGGYPPQAGGGYPPQAGGGLPPTQ